MAIFGSISNQFPDTSHIAPDEYAARRDALRAIQAMVPAQGRELYDLWLAVRENGQPGEPGTLRRLHQYAQSEGIGLSTVYFRMKNLAAAIQRHPWFDENNPPLPPAPAGRLINADAGPTPAPARHRASKIFRASRASFFHAAADSRRPQAPARKDLSSRLLSLFPDGAPPSH